METDYFDVASKSIVTELVTWERSVPGIYGHSFTSYPYLITASVNVFWEENPWYINMRSLNYPHVFL